MRLLALTALLLGLLLSGCEDEQETQAPPPPRTLTASAVGNYCGMRLVEHAGPKGQVFLAGQEAPVWFSSARDAIAFTMLPEEPKDVRAVYVSDMARADSWENPGADTWVEAHAAWFVIGSRVRGGMGADEAVPFSDEVAATHFSATHGGRIVRFADLRPEDVLGSNEADPAEAGAPAAAQSPRIGPHGHGQDRGYGH